MANAVFGVMMPYAVFGAAMPPPFSAEAYWKVRKYPAEGFMNFSLWRTESTLWILITKYYKGTEKLVGKHSTTPAIKTKPARKLQAITWSNASIPEGQKYT